MGLFGIGSNNSEKESYDRSNPHPEIEADLTYRRAINLDEAKEIFDHIYSDLDDWEDFRIEEPKHLESEEVVFDQENNVEYATAVGVFNSEWRGSTNTLKPGFHGGKGYELEEWIEEEHTPTNGYTFTHIYQLELPTGETGTEFYTFGPEPDSIYATLVSDGLNTLSENGIEDIIANNPKDAAMNTTPQDLENFGNHFREDLLERAGHHYADGDYDDAVRNAFILLENEIQDKGEFEQDLTGSELAQEAFKSEGPLVFGDTKAEELGVQFMYKGAFQILRNPASHRFLDDLEEEEAKSMLSTANLLLTWLDDNAIES